MTHPVIADALRDVAVSPHLTDNLLTRRDYVPPAALRTPAAVAARRPLPRADLKPQLALAPAILDAVTQVDHSATSGLPAAAILSAPASGSPRSTDVRSRQISREVAKTRLAQAPRKRADAHGYGARLLLWIAAQPGPVTYNQTKTALGSDPGSYLMRYTKDGRLQVRRCHGADSGRERNEWIPAGAEWPGPIPPRPVGPPPPALAATVVAWIAARPGPVTCAHVEEGLRRTGLNLPKLVAAGHLVARVFSVAGRRHSVRGIAQYTIPGRDWPPLPLGAVLLRGPDAAALALPTDPETAP